MSDAQIRGQLKIAMDNLRDARNMLAALVKPPAAWENLDVLKLFADEAEDIHRRVSALHARLPEA